MFIVSWLCNFGNIVAKFVLLTGCLRRQFLDILIRHIFFKENSVRHKNNCEQGTVVKFNYWTIPNVM